MADTFTHFSCVLDVRTPDNAVRALELYKQLAEAGASQGSPSAGFLLSIRPDQGGTELWLRDDVTGDPDRLIEFVKLCAAEFRLEGLWGFQYADTCSQPRTSAFGGGAHLLKPAATEAIDSIRTDARLAIVPDGGGPYV